MPVRPAAALLALALTSFSECPELPGPAFTNTAEEHWLRVDSKADTAEFVSLYRGLVPGEGDALAQLRRVVGKRRVFPPGGGWLTFDLDEPLDPARLANADARDLALFELYPSLSVTAAGLALDESGSACLWRVVRLERASECLRLGESSAMSGDGPHFPVGEFPAFDTRSSELLEAARARGERFASLAGDSLAIDVPSTAENAARILAHAFGAALAGKESDLESWAQLGTCLRHVEISGERLRVRLGPDESGWMRVSWSALDSAGAGARGPFDAATLRAAGFEIADSLAGRLPVPVR